MFSENITELRITKMTIKHRFEKYLRSESATPEGFGEMVQCNPDYRMSLAIVLAESQPSGYMRILDKYRKR